MMRDKEEWIPAIEAEMKSLLEEKKAVRIVAGKEAREMMEDPRYKVDLMPGWSSAETMPKEEEEIKRSLYMLADQTRCRSGLRRNAQRRTTGKELCWTSRQPSSMPHYTSRRTLTAHKVQEERRMRSGVGRALRQELVVLLRAEDRRWQVQWIGQRRDTFKG